MKCLLSERESCVHYYDTHNTARRLEAAREKINSTVSFVQTRTEQVGVVKTLLTGVAN
jgi:hypothetical protein